MIHIKTLDVNAPFRYLWLKRIIGIDLTKHCARCLLGDYIEGISPRKAHTTDIYLDDNIYYLCGVSQPYNWDKNFHLAFRWCIGSRIEYESNGISVVIEDAVRMPIMEKYIKEYDPNAKKKEFRTCRNWQFAHYLDSHPEEFDK